jgi:hypothetical protein
VILATINKIGQTLNLKWIHPPTNLKQRFKAFEACE